jgi:uncharacterized protein YodC (DUF2158 family)
MLKRRSAAAGFSAVILFALAVAWTGPVAAEPAVSHGDSLAAPILRTGDLVRLRSGGPLMTVDKVEDDQVICYYSTEYGEVRSGSFRIAELSAPLTLPPADPNQQKDEAATDRYYRNHCPSGFTTFTGKFVCAY